MKNTPFVISVVLNVIFLFVIIIMALKKTKNCADCPVCPAIPACPTTKEMMIAEYWAKNLRPPSIDEKIYVYVSSPLFNLSEILYSVGIEGMLPENNVVLIDSLCNLNPAELQTITNLSKGAGIPSRGLAGVLNDKGWASYIPARDGFVLAKFISSLFTAESAPVLASANMQASEVAGYLTKAIYAFDVFALSSLCNTCIFNSDGLQIDDGSATEIGMIGVRGMPAVYVRNQATEQFGVGASNPMPLGNANSLINQKAFTVYDAVNLLDQKIKNIKNTRDQWWSGIDYDSQVAPPPLIIFWIEVGNAVFNVRYKSRDIVMNNKGFQDTKASSTDFFYQNYYVDAQGNKAGKSDQLTKISVEIAKQIKAVELKWKDFMMTYGACAENNRDFQKVLQYGCPY